LLLYACWGQADQRSSTRIWLLGRRDAPSTDQHGHAGRRTEFEREVSGGMEEGRVKWEGGVVEGIERAPEAFIGLFHGENLGKMLVKV